MKKIEINFNTLLLIVAIGILIFYRGPGGGGSSSGRDTILNQIIIKYDSLDRQIPPSVNPKNYYSFNIQLDHRDSLDIPQVIDSLQVVMDYYSKHVDVDIRRDSNLEVTIQDTISRNRRIGRYFSYKILRPFAEQHILIREDRSSTRLYLGAFGGNQMAQFSAGPSIGLIAGKSENLYGVDYDVFSKFPDNIRISFKKLISFRRNKPP